MQRRSVDLPEPDGPAITIASPVAIDRSMPSRTRCDPKLLRTSWISMRCPFEVVTFARV